MITRLRSEYKLYLLLSNSSFLTYPAKVTKREIDLKITEEICIYSERCCLKLVSVNQLCNFCVL